MQNAQYDNDGEEEYLEEEEEVVTTTTKTKKGKKGKKIIHTNVTTTITKIKNQEDEEGNDNNYINSKSKISQIKKDNDSNLNNNDKNINKNSNKQELTNQNKNNFVINQTNLNNNKTINQTYDNTNNINKTNSLTKDNNIISVKNKINNEDNTIKHKSSYIPIEQPKNEYTLSDNPEIEKKIKDLFLNKIHSSDFNKMKCFKKWKLNIIKPKIFLGKKDRKIRLRTRIYIDEPAKSSSIISRRKKQAEVIVTNPIKRNPNLKHNEYKNYIIHTNQNKNNFVQQEKKIKSLAELYNENLKEEEKKEAIKKRKLDSIKMIKDIFNKRKREAFEKLKNNQKEKKMNEGLNKLNDLYIKNKKEDEKEVLDNLKDKHKLKNIRPSQRDSSIIEKEMKNIENTKEEKKLDDCCIDMKLLNGWLFLKINSYIVYEKNCRMIKQYFSKWKKYAGIRDIENNEIKNIFQH